MEAFVQQVRAQTDILAVVQGYVSLKRKGNRYWGCCPFHNEKTASFSVVPAEGFFYCFGCHAGGDAFKFISLMEHITPFEAIKRQAEQLGIPLPERKRDAREEARLRAILAQRLGTDIEFNMEVDPSVIGGVRVSVRDLVMDSTVRSSIARLRTRLTG